MWDVLKEYPAARVRLEAIAVKRLEKYKKAPLEKGKRKKPQWSLLNVARNFLVLPFQLLVHLKQHFLFESFSLSGNAHNNKLLVSPVVLQHVKLF